MLQTEKDVFWYLNLTTEQEDAYKKFEAHLKGNNLLVPDHDDRCTLLRFLKARQWDIVKATHMYQEMASFRNENRVDDVYEKANYTSEQLKKVQEFYPHFYHKTDKFGRPVYIELLGQSDPHSLLEFLPSDKFVEYRIFTWERLERVYLPACSKAIGKPIITTTVIVDMSGLSLKQFTFATRKMMIILSKIDQDHYPEHLGQMFIINAPFVFKTFWACLYPLLEERTRKKIIVLGSDYQDTLKNIVPEENLLECFGGKSSCTERVNIGPWNPLMPNGKGI